MKISTSWAQQLSLNSILDRQAQLSKIQIQLSNGKKLQTPSDDPAAAARVIDLNHSIKRAEQYQKNIDAARQRLTFQDGLLQSAVDILQRIKELGIQGLNDTSSPNDRNNVATEMNALKDQLVAIANTRNANGEYLFAGFKSDQQPFTQVPLPGGGYSYGGDLNQRNIQIGTDRLIADGNSGISIFGAPTGTNPQGGPSPGIDNIFEAIDKFAADLTNNAPQATSMADISSAMNKMTNVRTTIGVRLNVLDRQESINADHILNMKTVLSDTEDADYAETISQFNLQTLALQAAQQAFAHVQKLSLFNLI